MEKLAEKDLDAAMILLDKEHLSNIVLFHCQQCIEKALKALLEESGEVVPKIHNIYKLHTIIKEQTKYDSILLEDELDIIDSIYIDTRYPGNFGILPAGFPTQKESKQCIKIAEKVYRKVVEFLM